MKKRWIILGVGTCLVVGGGGYLAWTELLGGASALSGRDYPAERAALLERTQTPQGRDRNAKNFFDELAAWDAVNGEIALRLTKEWEEKGARWPGLDVPMRADDPGRTAENREQLALSETASAQFYKEAVEHGLVKHLDAIAAAPRAVRAVNAPFAFLSSDQAMMSQGRALARIIRYRMVEALKSGDAAEYGRCHTRMLRTADAFARQHTLIDRLVAVAILVLEQNGLREDLAMGKVSASQADAVVKEMNAVVASWPSWATTFEGEAIEVQDLLANGAAGPGGPSRVLGSAEVNQIRWAFKEVARAADMPRKDRTPVIAAVEKAVDAAPPWRMTLRTLLPAFSAACRTMDQIAADTNGLTAIVAVERYKAIKGSLPKDLNALVPEFLPAVPADPFGDVVKYKLLDKPDAFGRGYAVYSVGFDGKDNGGAWPSTYAMDALKKTAPNTDYPLSRVDER
jgi:hypothetical protein